MAATRGDSRVLCVNDRDALMEDVGERGWPPGEPSDALGSWAAKVKGSVTGRMQIPEEILEDDFVSERLLLEFLNGEVGEPLITIGHEVLDAMKGLWKKCMFVKVLGLHVSILVLNRKLRELWKPRGAMHVMDLPCHFFMVRFEDEEEFIAALTVVHGGLSEVTLWCKRGLRNLIR